MPLWVKFDYFRRSRCFFLVNEEGNMSDSWFANEVYALWAKVWNNSRISITWKMFPNVRLIEETPLPLLYENAGFGVLLFVSGIACQELSSEITTNKTLHVWAAILNIVCILLSMRPLIDWFYVNKFSRCKNEMNIENKNEIIFTYNQNQNKVKKLYTFSSIVLYHPLIIIVIIIRPL